MAEKTESIMEQRDQLAEAIKSPPRCIRTGCKPLDIALCGGVSAGLYILGAESSTGKTAFMMELAQRMAQRGVNVLYFSLEMSQIDLVARSISRLSFLAHMERAVGPVEKKAYSVGDILGTRYDMDVQDFVKVPFSAYGMYFEEFCKNYGAYLFIVEDAGHDMTAKNVQDIVKNFKEQRPKDPLVVYVDYLQILRGEDADRKNRLDASVLALKSLASSLHVPVITCSSVNRVSYGSRVSAAAYKESGEIEYTADVLLGWNWRGVTDAANKQDAEAERKKCAENGYRRMELEILKFRNGQRDCSIDLTYYPAYHCFFCEGDYEPEKPYKIPFKDEDDRKTKKPTKAF